MVRTQIQLPEEQVTFLKKVAAVRHKSMAEIIRQAVDLFAQSTQEPDNEQRRRQAIAAAGRFRSGTKNLAADHDTYLAEIFGR